MQKPQKYPIDLLALEALEDIKPPSIAETPRKTRLPSHFAVSWPLGRNKRVTITRYNGDIEENYKAYETDTARGRQFEFRDTIETENFIVDEEGRVHRDTMKTLYIKWSICQNS